MVRAFTNFPQTLSESKFAKIQISPYFGRGEGFMETNFQLLMLSPNLLKSKVPILGEGEFVETNFQLLLLSPNLLKSRVPFWGWGGLLETNFQLLLLSPNLLKSKVPIFWGGGGACGNQFPTFDAESKFAEIQSFHFPEGGGGGRVEGLVEPLSNF